MQRRWGVRALVVLVMVAGLFGACRSSSSDPAVRLDGSPRVPDREGVVTRATPEWIEIDGKRFDVEEEIVVFSTYNRRAIRLGAVLGDYVHVGLDGDKAVWLARVGRVVRTDPAKPVVIYQGTLRKVTGARLDFTDGTVLRLQPGLRVPQPLPAGISDVVIDVTTKRVRGIRLPPDNSSTTASTGP